MANLNSSNASSGRIEVVTPTDSANLNGVSREIIMSTGNDGTLSAVDASGETVTIPTGTLITGARYAFQLQKINSTNTTATAVVVLF